MFRKQRGGKVANGIRFAQGQTKGPILENNEEEIAVVPLAKVVLKQVEY